MSLVAVRQDSLDVSTQSWVVMKEQAGMLVKSGFLPTSVKTAEAAVAIMLKGRELGIPPMQAFSQIHVINGKPAISAELMLALIYRTHPKARIEIERYDNEACHIMATRPGDKPTLFTFSVEDGKRAGLTRNPTWTQYPRAMCRSRCIAEMARTKFPDALMGCSYTPEELGADVSEDGEILDTTTTVVSKSVTPPPEKTAEPPQQKKGGVGYNGSTEHLEYLHKTLIARNVPEEFWEEIHLKMMGKTFPDLGGVLDEVRRPLNVIDNDQ